MSPYDMVRDAARSVQQRLTRQRQERDAYRRLFETEDGKTVLRHLLKAGYATKSTFVAGDPHQTSLNEGKRLLVLSILNYTTKNPEQYIEEAMKDENTKVSI